MRIDVVGRHFEVTDAIREHAEKKAEKLLKYYDGVQQVVWRINGEDHHHSGEFEVELVVSVVHHEDFVATAREGDVYAAIDQAMHKATRQVKEFKDKLRLGNR